MNKLIPLLCILALAACGKKEETVIVEPVAASAPESQPIVLFTPTPEEQLAAMVRGNPGTTKVCIDGERNNTFFIEFGPLLGDHVPDDGYVHGWWYAKDVKFFMTSNKTYFIIDISITDMSQVYPDITGLTCKN